MPLRLILTALILMTAGGLGLIAYQAVRPKPDFATPQVVPPPPPPKIGVLAAAHPLQAGLLVKDEDFTPKLMASTEMPEGALVDSPEVRANLRGSLLRRYLEAGAAVTAADVLRPRDRGFLAAVLTAGMRALSVGVDAVTGVGGLIWPGDRVDVILTQELDNKDAPLAKRVVGETALSDVRVVAVDQSIAQGAASSGGSAGRLARTITLEVTPEQAERVVVAQRLGHLALAIRAAEVAAIPSEPGKTSVFGGDVSPALAGAGVPLRARIRLIQGNTSQELRFE